MLPTLDAPPQKHWVLKSFVTFWLPFSGAIALFSYFIQAYAEYNRHIDNPAGSFFLSLFSCVSPAIITALFAINLITTILDKPWLLIVFLPLTITVAQAMALPRINSINTAIEAVQVLHRARETLLWCVFIANIAKDCNSFIAILKSIMGLRKIKSFKLSTALLNLLGFSLASVLLFTNSGGIKLGIENAPKEFSQPIAHYFAKIPNLALKLIYTLLLAFQYASLVAKGLKTFLEDLLQVRNLKRCACSWNILLSFLKGLGIFILTFAPPVAQLHFSRSAGTKSPWLLGSAFSVSAVINRGGASRFFDSKNSDVKDQLPIIAQNSYLFQNYGAKTDKDIALLAATDGPPLKEPAAVSAA